MISRISDLNLTACGLLFAAKMQWPISALTAYLGYELGFVVSLSSQVFLLSAAILLALKQHFLQKG